jgi:tRNA U34 2-thiouridine synthase MnmA/TrmU
MESKKERPVRGIGLISGGLDSMLAPRILMDLGIDVVGITFKTPFFGSERGERSAQILGIRHIVLDITEDHLVMVKDPAHGYGRNMNPCIDCHAMMFKKAGDLLGDLQADFLFSGEVLGQRPMSQNPEALRTVEKTSGYEGLILRPLSARLLPETEVEISGLVDRSRLLDIQGRSRKSQMALAEKLGIVEFPSPGGGCLLTDPGFSVRLKELFTRNPDATALDIERLKVGRHFRSPGGTKIVVGRHQADNEILTGLVGSGDFSLRVNDYPGPLTMVEESATGEDLHLAASITVRYSKASEKKKADVDVKGPDGREETITVAPADDEVVEEYRIA